MIYAFEEQIGEPSLFCGRKQQMELLMNWIEMIPRKMAKSRALLGRRKSGKSAIMQRLFNLLWNQQGQVIPFYFEVLDHDQWLLDFADAYYRTFMSQYLSFKTRTILPLNNRPWNFTELTNMARNIGAHNTLKHIDFFQEYLEKEQINQAMTWAFGAPAEFAGIENAFFLVMIDEIQYMTKHIFWDKADKVHQVPARRLPGAYHSLVQSKVAPMLVSGSYVSWMTQMMREIFVGGRLKRTKISPKLAVNEGMEAVYRYAEYNHKAISDDAALVINLLTQSDPFYIASLFRSDWENQDFTSVEGAIKTLAYEIRDREGELFGTWSEYILLTIKTINDQHAKKILLYLSKERHKECTRVEINDHLGNPLSDRDLEDKLRALEYGDLIAQGSNNFRYCGIQDDILDLIFRDLYQEEIDNEIPNIANELALKVATLEKEKKSLTGALSELKGRMLELIVYRELNQCRKKRQPIAHFRPRLRPILSPQNATTQLETRLATCCVNVFDRVWMNYPLFLPNTTAVELDVLAEGEDAERCWAVVFEIKNRDEKHLPTMVEAQLFVEKIKRVEQWLGQTGKTVKEVCSVFLSAEGFNSEIEAWLQEQGVLTTDMVCWEHNE